MGKRGARVEEYIKLKQRCQERQLWLPKCSPLQKGCFGALRHEWAPMSGPSVQAEAWRGDAETERETGPGDATWADLRTECGKSSQEQICITSFSERALGAVIRPPKTVGGPAQEAPDHSRPRFPAHSFIGLSARLPLTMQVVSWCRILTFSCWKSLTSTLP